MNPLILILAAAVVTVPRGVVSMAAVEPVASSIISWTALRAASASAMTSSSAVTEVASVAFSSSVQVTEEATISSATSVISGLSTDSPTSISTRAMYSVQLVATALMLLEAAASTAALA